MLELIDNSFSKIYKVKKPFDEKDIWKNYNIYVKEWFYKNFQELTPPQRYSLKLIKDKKNLLIFSPTGSGKTLSAFLAIIDELISLSLKNKLENRVYVIYISPLRALNNDIKRNLEKPLNEIKEIIKNKLEINIDIRIGIRTSDSSSYEKQKHLKKPPHILITTPETFAIILNTQKFKEHLKKVNYVIIDEIHELASSKRGVHLTISLERLSRFVYKNSGYEPIRIGLSATIHPIEEIAKFLAGKDREIIIVDTTLEKKYEVKAVFPTKNVFYNQEELEKDLYGYLGSLIKKYKTILIFTNTRHGTESVVWKLKNYFPELKDKIEAHHSSLSREVRLNVEKRLKEGELKVVVCLDKNSEILTEKGYVKIKDLIKEKNLKIYGFDDKLKLQNFEDIIKLEGNFMGYELILDNGKRIRLTRDHQLLVYNHGKPTWKKVEDIKEGDLLYYI